MEKREMIHRTAWLPVFAAVVAMAGCATSSTVPPSDTLAGGASASSSAFNPPSTASGDARPSTSTVTRRYVVRRGDTLTAIASASGCSVDALRTWNDLGTGGRLRVGQTLRIATTTVAMPASAASAATNRAPPAASAAGMPNPPAARGENDSQIVKETRRHATGVSLAWPVRGDVIESFRPGRNRGIQIAGRAGDPVRAAADGRVMFAGIGLNGYGSLIIVQHNADFLTAYAHNRKLLVKTGDIVHRGDAIAEMGDLDNSRVALAFEVRRDGQPVNPLPYLPAARG